MEAFDQEPLVSTEERSMPLGGLCAEAGIVCSPELTALQVTVTGVTADSRKVRPGWLFVAIRGMHRDATLFIAQAVEAGAVAVVSEPLDPVEGREQAPFGVPILTVPDARVAMAHLFDAWYGHPAKKLCLIGVTGTNGKTSVSAMLHHILTAAGVPAGLIGTVGSIAPDGSPVTIRSADERANMTTPDPEELYAILAYMAAHVKSGEASAEAPSVAPVVIMEATSHALALGKLSPLTFDIGIFTNLTPEHLDFHKTMDTYYAAKRRLFEVTRVGVVNADDPWGRRLLDEPLAVKSWQVCEVTARDIQEEKPCRNGDCCRVYAGQLHLRGSDGVEYRLTTPRARLRVRCPVPGEFTVHNTMLAAVAALELGISPDTVRGALATFPGVPGRMERVPLGERAGYAVFIDYAHTPDALENLLATARRFRRRGQRIVLLFGCGGDRDRTKRPLMAAVASRMADRVIVTSDNSRSEDPNAIIADILAGMAQDSAYEVIPNRTQAIRHVIETAHRGDIILLAGKGHEQYEIDAQGKHPFSERDIVLAAASYGNK